MQGYCTIISTPIIVYVKNDSFIYLFFCSLQQIIGSLSRHDVDGSKNVIWKCNFAFLQSFFNYSKTLCLKKCVLTIPGIKLETALVTEEDKIEQLSSYTNVVHTTAKQVISRGRKNENVFKMSKNEKCTCKACKNTVFHYQICKFVGFLLPSSSWLLKFPTAAGSPGRYNLKYENFTSLLGGLRRKTAAKRVPHVQYDYLSLFNQWNRWFVALS